MLWTLLLGICFLIAIAGALNSAEAAQASWKGYALAVLVGSAVGACCIWTLTRIASKVEATTSKLGSAPTRERWLGALYISTVLWMALAAIIGGWSSNALIHLVR